MSKNHDAIMLLISELIDAKIRQREAERSWLNGGKLKLPQRAHDVATAQKNLSTALANILGDECHESTCQAPSRPQKFFPPSPPTFGSILGAAQRDNK